MTNLSHAAFSRPIIKMPTYRTTEIVEVRTLDSRSQQLTKRSTLYPTSSSHHVIYGLSDIACAKKHMASQFPRKSDSDARHQHAPSLADTFTSTTAVYSPSEILTAPPRPRVHFIADNRRVGRHRTHGANHDSRAKPSLSSKAPTSEFNNVSSHSHSNRCRCPKRSCGVGWA